MAADRDISAQEAVHILLGDQLIGCSQAFINLKAKPDTCFVLWKTVDLDLDDCMFEDSFFMCYEKCMDCHSELNAIEYCKRFNIKKGLYLIFHLRDYHFENSFVLFIFAGASTEPFVGIKRLLCIHGLE